VRRAGAYDRGEKSFARSATAVAKYWICKRGPGHAAEALECLGGNGFVEESVLPRLYRQQPLNAIWEGSSNVICLDVLRALRRTPETLEAFLDECRPAAGEALVADSLRRVERALEDAEASEAGARRLVEQMALTLQASLLVRHAPTWLADAFCTSRLGGDGGFAYGTLPSRVDAAAIVERHRPAL
jgi:putative acyl-CoA dehydrogenase